MAKKYSIWQRIELFMLLLLAMAFLNRSGYIFLAMVIVVLFMNINRIKISVLETELLFFGLSYFIFYYHTFGTDFYSIVVYAIGPVGAFLLGKLFVLNSNKPNAMLCLMITLALGMLVHGLLNWYAYWQSSYVLSYDYLRLSVDFWRKDLVSVTNTGMLFTYSASLSMGILFTQVEKKYKILAILVITICISATVFFANRTLIYVIAIIFLWKCLKLVFSKKTSKQRRNILVFSMFVFLFILVLVFLLGAESKLYSLISDLKIIDRFDGNNTVDSRFLAWGAFFSDFRFLRFPFGGKMMLKDLVLSNGKTVNYFHNMWLDTYNVAGIIPFVILLIFTVHIIKKRKEFIRTSQTGLQHITATCFDCMSMGAVLNFSVEPILEGNPYYFLMFIMCLGAMWAELNKQSEKCSITDYEK